MAVSIVVQKSGTGEEKRKLSISSPLIDTEPQAVIVGKQELYSWFYRTKNYKLSVPYRGLLDGDIVGIYCDNPSVNSKYRVTSLQIKISKKSGVSVNMTVEGEYDNPFN